MVKTRPVSTQLDVTLKIIVGSVLRCASIFLTYPLLLMSVASGHIGGCFIKEKLKCRLHPDSRQPLNTSQQSCWNVRKGMMLMVLRGSLKLGWGWWCFRNGLWKAISNWYGDWCVGITSRTPNKFSVSVALGDLRWPTEERYSLLMFWFFVFPVNQAFHKWCWSITLTNDATST